MFNSKEKDMAKRSLTIKVSVNEENYYFPIESYIMQCALYSLGAKSSSGSTEEEIKNGTTSLWGKLNYKSSNFEYILASKATTNSIEYVCQFINSVPLILLEKKKLWYCPTTSPQNLTKVIAPNTEYSLSYNTSAGRTANSYYNSDLCKYEEQPAISVSCAFAYYFQSVARYLVASCSETDFQKIVSFWKTCIAATLDVEADKITYTNEPISE
ncbi:MAG: hypothetical protein IKR17_04790 [Bacteroidales bacterium]|nr:hypothetical protein [Bacteroidales bacterium]